MPRQPRPIPPDPDGQNNQRAQWAEAVLIAFAVETGTEREDALCDLLTDLRHWCDRNNTSFGSELERATRHYKEETRAPEAPVIPVQVAPPQPPPDNDVPF